MSPASPAAMQATFAECLRVAMPKFVDPTTGSFRAWWLSAVALRKHLKKEAGRQISYPQKLNDSLMV